MAEHCVFLTAWKDLVEEDVKVEYFKDRVEKLPRRGLPFVRFVDPGADEDEKEGDEARAIESGRSEADWEGWILGKWPKAVNKVKGPIGTQ